MNSAVLSPITATTEVLLLRKWDCRELIRRWREQLEIDVSDELQGISHIDHYLCKRTQLEFFRPLSAAGSGKFYERLQQQSWYYMPHKWEHDAALADLCRRRISRVLEVGCGIGSFVQMLRNRGINARGIELNAAAVTEAQRKGLPVEQTDLYDLAGHEPGTCDAVCAFQVLEHVTEPKRFIQAMLRLLKMDGLLIVSVPNMDSFLQFDPGLLLNLPPHHMSRWKRKTFRALRLYLPLELMHCLEEPLAEYHVTAYVRLHVGRVIPWRPGRAVVSRLLQPLYRIAAIRRRCRGHSLYACFVKSGEDLSSDARPEGSGGTA